MISEQGQRNIRKSSALQYVASPLSICSIFLKPLFEPALYFFSFSFSYSSSLFTLLFFYAMALRSSSILINRNILLYSIERFNNNEIFDKLNSSSADLKNILRWVFGTRCEAVVKLAKIRREKARRRFIRALSMSQFLSLLTKMSLIYEDVLAGLREMRTDQVLQVLRAGIAMPLYCQKDANMHHMLRRVLVDNKMFIGHVIGARYMQKILKTLPQQSLMAQEMLRRSAFQMQLYFFAFMFLQACMGTKLVSTTRTYNSGMLLGFAGQVVMKAGNAFTRAA